MPTRFSIRILPLIGLASLAACGAHEAPRPLVPALQKVSVTTEKLGDSARSVSEEVVGTVRARSVAEVSSSVMGTIQQQRAVVGRTVRAGEVLVVLAAREIDAKAAQAEALHARAEVDLKRAEALHAAKSIPLAQYDAAKAQFAVAEAALAEAEVMRGYTAIRAPISGVITAKLSGVGDLAVPGKPLFVVENPDGLRLEAPVPEGVASSLVRGATMKVTLDVLGETVEGKLSELAPAADPLSRTTLVKVDLPRSDKVHAGMFGRLSVPVGETQVLSVPASAVVRRGQLETVFVAEEGKANLRIVRTTERPIAGRLEVTSGLSAGDEVITSDPQKLVENQPVEMKL
jgi:RND family efflux transporter MFP subunit